jgi:cytochrome c oxidase subunit 1
MQLSTYVITIPSLASLYAILATMYLGNFKWNTTTKYAFVGIIGWFVAGLQGFLNATVFTNNFIHNTLWVVGHFHTMAILNVGFGFFAFTFYIIPKYTGRNFNKKLISIHFWGTLIGTIGMTHLWLLQGLLGFLRRSATLPAEANFITMISIPFFLLLAIVQIFFVLALWKNIWGSSEESESFTPYADVSF